MLDEVRVFCVFSGNKNFLVAPFFMSESCRMLEILSFFLLVGKTIVLFPFLLC